MGRINHQNINNLARGKADLNDCLMKHVEGNAAAYLCKFRADLEFPATVAVSGGC